MPFTPYHLGPALLLGYATRRRVSWPTFILANVVVDTEPLIAFTGLLGRYPLHGYLHTFVSAALCGTTLGYLVYLARRPLRSFLDNLALVEGEVSLKGYLVAGIAGWALHVSLDTPLYPDIMPLYPLRVNPLYGAWQYPVELLSLLLVAGIALYLVHAYTVTRRRRGSEAALMQVGLLSVLFSLVIASTWEQSLFPAFVALTAGGVLAFYTPLLKLAGFRCRVLTSLILVLLSVATAAMNAFSAVINAYPDIEALVDTSVQYALIPWCLALAGLILLRRPVKSAVSSGRLATLFDLLTVGWILALFLVGIPVVAIALLLLASKIAGENPAERPPSYS